MAVIGIISDTHIPKRAPSVPGAALRALEGADMIIHAGKNKCGLRIADCGMKIRNPK
ncbi:MAG: hypothetical protein ABIH66_08880 [bacterium]